MKHPIISFRRKLMSFMIIAIAFPTLTSGYLMIDHAEKALLKEKENKLYALTRQLDHLLPYSFNHYLGPQQNKMSREEKINRLNLILGPRTDLIAKENPGIGVGYYSKELNAIITYGPSQELKDKIGLSIDHTHPGNQVLQHGTPLVFTGKQVRGNIMNAMTPLIRDGNVIGYVWANELTRDVADQMQKMEHNIWLILIAGMLIGILIALKITNTLGRSIEKMEEQIRRTDRLKALGELAAGMAHEIRNPLTSIKAFSQIAEESFPAEDPNREYMGIIVKEVERINRLIEQLLLFGRPSIEKEELVNLPDLIRQSLFLIDYELKKKELNLTQEFEVVQMRADYNLIQQIIVNLLLNAIHAVNQGGTLEIKTMVNPTTVAMSFFNSGSSIAENQKEKIFNPFFTSKDHGIGLGLSVTQNIVHLYKGKIFFENVNHGVKFQVEFPREEIVYGKDSCSG
jgi:signal transduction histidine kinase